MKLKGKVAIVTGAGRGIGKAIAVAFAKEGAKVVCAARTKGEIETTAREIDGQAVQCDVASENDTRNLIETTLKHYHRIDILVNNAGAVARLRVHELPVEEWDHVINVNVRGTFLCTKFALPTMLKQKSGCIINTSSGAGKTGVAERTAYCAAKFAIIGFTEALWQEVKGTGVRAHVICPGPTVSEMRRSGFPNEDPNTLIQAEDIAGVAVFLATQKATAYTPEVIVQTGLTIKNL